MSLNVNEEKVMNSKHSVYENSEHTLNWSKYSVISQNNSNNILIVTEARSGSTFLGDLLQQSWPTFYSFEPLVGAMKSKNPRTDSSTSEEAIQLLNNLFECKYDDLSEDYLQPIFWKVPYFHWNSVITQTIQMNKNQYFNQTLNEYICMRCPNKLIKTIRFGVEDFIKMRQKSKSPIKLVFLVRDPRGVMSSRYRMNWCLNSPNCSDVEVLCQRIRADINALTLLAKWSNESVTLVRYEDIALNANEMSEKLYKRLNLTFGPLVRTWLKEHTENDDLLGNPHSTIRRSNATPFSWTSRMSGNDIVEVQEFCSDVMEILGYKAIPVLDYDDNDTTTFVNYTLEQLLEQTFPLHNLLP